MEKKHTSWDTLFDCTDKSVLPVDKSSFKKQQKLNALEPVFAEFNAKVDFYLKHLLIDSIIYRLDFFNKQGWLCLFMNYTNYRLFDWSLKQRNVDLATYLLKNLPRNTLIIILNRERYAALKDFIQCASKISDIRNNPDDDTARILSPIIDIDNWEINKIIKATVLESYPHVDTIKNSMRM